MTPKGDEAETARPPLRPARSDQELDADVSAVLASYSSIPRAQAPAAPADRASARLQVAKYLPKDDLSQRVIVSALESMTFHDLWWTLFGLEDFDTHERIALKYVARATARERVAWERLRAFAASVTGLFQTAEVAAVLDRVERGLVGDVAWARTLVATARGELDDARCAGPKRTSARRQAAVRRLRSALPSWTWKRIAMLIDASGRLTPPPCPQFVSERDGDVDGLEAWLRQRYRDRRP